MRYRDSILNHVDVLESQLKTLRRMVQRGESVKTFMDALDQTEERLSKVKEFVNLEPVEAGEIGGRTR